MATKVSVATVTGNPTLHVTTTSDRDRRARQYSIGEWDMLTYAGGNPKQLLDQSGKNNHFLFINNPNVGTQGVTFDGVNYADMTLSAAMGDNFSFLLVAKSIQSGGYYGFGSWNTTEARGQAINFATTLQLLFNPSNSATGPTLLSQWGAGLYTMEGRQGRARSLSGGWLGTNHTPVPNVADDIRPLWRMGAQAQTIGGDTSAVYQPLPTGNIIAYAMLFNRIVDYRQSFCLHEYIKEKMAARGITYL